MGSTLTNTQPKDTYKSLLKTSDSSELSATAKYVSDGNGNDSPLALSNAAVGIGTASPAGTLHVAGGDIYVGASYGLKFSSNSFISPENNVSGAEISTAGVFVVKTGVTPTERIRVTTDGLTFNGDTASANALDDYEEGTFTPTVTFGGASTGITYSTQVGVYTKIGKVVTVRWGFRFSSKGSATGSVKVQGLPFTIQSLAYGDATGACSYALLSSSVTTAVVAIGGNGATDIYLRRYELGNEIPLNDSNFNNNSYIYGTFVYTVV